MTFTMQIFWLFILAIPIACVSWTVTHEEIFREIREYCERVSHKSKNLFTRKFFYIFTCEYCFSHYVTILALIFTRYTLLFSGWLGYIIAGFSLVAIANVYMSLFGLIRVDIRAQRVDAELKEELESKLK